MNNNELIVPSFGFINNGNICYFNSLLQNILNCKYIMHYLINEQKPKNELQEFFKNKFIQFTKLYNDEENEKDSRKHFNHETSIFSYQLLKILLKKYNQFDINQQQSSSEFFLYLIEELGIEHFFKIRHIINIHCGNCRNVSTKFDECFHFEMFCEEEQSVDIDNFMYSVNVINDYKCDKCKSVSKSLYEKKAENISKYFVVLLNKYFNKVKIEYPNKFQITIKNNKEPGSNLEKIIDNYIPVDCIWENIGQIEHSGHLNSGHYTSVCKRMEKIFIFDDIKVDQITNSKEKNVSIKPTKNTYMIFYEKQN
jgi:ubiquitin carboxyl-terminal hydrolase 8